MSEFLTREGIRQFARRGVELKPETQWRAVVHPFKLPGFLWDCGEKKQALVAWIKLNSFASLKEIWTYRPWLGF